MVSQDPKTGETVFIHASATARKVFLAGSFNAWSPTDRRMVKTKDGSFRARLALPAGRHEYKFVVDGVWLNDPQAPEEIRNGCGTTNAVVVVKD